MFNRHLPEPVYEHLPWIYAAVAVVVAIVFGSAWRWIPVAALLAACAVTSWQRYRYRSTRTLTERRPTPRNQRVYVPGNSPGADRRAFGDVPERRNVGETVTRR